MTDYTLTRSKRKTIAIRITKDAAVEVRAPLKTPKSDIDRFVASKRDWIDKHLSAREQSVQSKTDFTLSYGDTVFMLGKEYPIAAKDGNRVGFDGEHFCLPPNLPPEDIKYAVIQIYKMVAKNLLTDKVIDYAKRMNVIPAAVKINGAKTRWGSCSGKNSVNFSWRQIMADDEVVDYAVVHELAHIREHNHSDRFWAVVEGVLPDYKERQTKLKELQKRLADEGWE